MQNLIGAQMARFLGMLILFAVVWILPAPPAVAEMVTVPAGEFMMGCSVNDADCENDEGSQGVSQSMFPSSGSTNMK